MTFPYVRRASLLVTVLSFAALPVFTVTGRAQAGAPETVHFVALTADGTPVPDLSASQVTLKIDGRARAVASLEFVRLDAHANALPAPFASNAAAASGRDFVVVVDEESIAVGTENPVRQALLAFAAAIPARDRIAFFTVPRGTQALAPTTDRAAFKAAVAGLQGRASGTGAGNSGCHGREVLTALSSIVTRTSRPAGPTPVVLFSAGIAAPDTAVSDRVPGAAPGQSVLESQQCKLTQREFQVLGQAVEAARSPFFVVRPEEGGRSDGLESVVGVTGGQMLARGRTADDAMVRIAKQTSGDYVATFNAEAADRNGASHRVELQTARPDVTLRSRANITIARAEKNLNPQSLLRTAAVHTAFGLRAIAVASRNDGDAKVKLVGLAEPIDPAVTITAAAAGVYDRTGKLIAQWTAKPEELQRPMIAAALVVPAGEYRVRVAALDAAGRAATVDYDINAEMVSAGVAHLGGLLIGGPGAPFMPQLQFSTEPEVTVYFELYGRPAGEFEASVELAETAEGPAMASALPSPAATAIQDKFIFTARLPLASVKPGDYVVRARIKFPGQPAGVLQRTIRKR
jgi:hypothetical protein